MLKEKMAEQIIRLFNALDDHASDKKALARDWENYLGEILNLFKPLLDKLTVIDDEEIAKAVWGEWNAEHLRVAQAQLQHDKQTLLDLMGE